MKLYDTFCFFNELELLKLRCETMKELNPIHVLVEATTTHTGDPKPLYFDDNKEKFSEYNIRHLIIDLPNNGNAWDSENAQRDAIVLALYDADDEDLIVVSDLDEIVNPDIVKLFNPKEHKVAGLKQDKYSYYLNCLEGVQCWEIAKLTTWEYLKKTTPNKLRNGGHDSVILNAGWHFSFLGGVEKMIEKLYAYAHTETVKPELLDNIEYKYKTGQSMWAEDYWRFVKIDNTFPKYLQEHQDEFKDLIKQI